MQSSLKSNHEYILFDKDTNLKLCEGTFEEINKFIVKQRCGDDYETFIGTENKFINVDEDEVDVELEYYELFFFIRNQSPLFKNDLLTHLESKSEVIYANKKAWYALAEKRLFQRLAIKVLRDANSSYRLCRKS